MATRRRPRREAVRIALTGLATGHNLFDIADDLAALHPKNETFPGEVLRVFANEGWRALGLTA